MDTTNSTLFMEIDEFPLLLAEHCAPPMPYPNIACPSPPTLHRLPAPDTPRECIKFVGRHGDRTRGDGGGQYRTKSRPHTDTHTRPDPTHPGPNHSTKGVRSPPGRGEGDDDIAAAGGPVRSSELVADQAKSSLTFSMASLTSHAAISR